MKSITPLFIAFTAIILCSLNAKAQDTLIMKNGSRIGSKIIEISPTEVKYKKADNPDGPTFITNAYDINMIKYNNGTMDTLRAQAPKGTTVIAVPVAPKVIDPYPPIRTSGPFFKYEGRHIRAKEMYQVIAKTNDPEINLEIKKAKTTKLLRLVGFLAIPAVIGAGVGGILMLGEVEEGPYVAIGCGAVAVLSLATNITATSLHKKHNRKALQIYNEKY